MWLSAELDRMVSQNVGGSDRLIRAVLAVGFSILALRALTNRKPLTAVVAGLSAIGFGFNATTCFCGLNEALGVDTSSD